MLLCIAPYFRPKSYKLIRNERFFFINVPELDQGDRVGLFMRYCRLYDLDLDKTQIANFAGLLTGYPEQVAYAVDLIANAGVDKAWRESKEIVDFSNFRASKYVERYVSDQDKVDFLRFMASFDFMSLSFISEIAVIVRKPLASYVDEFIGDAICERIGVAGEYIRLNDVVRDFVSRGEFNLQKHYVAALRTFTETFLKTYESDDYDVSEYFIAIKEALENGREIPERLLTPAHFVRSMRDLYNRGSTQSYQQIVRLARRVLDKSNSYDEATQQNIRYYLCQSLARLRDKTFLAEVQGIKGPEHTFLLGFYYRLQERYDEAIEKFLVSMNDKRTDQRSRRELVLAYVSLERYGDALQIAKENYQKYPSNPLLIQAYFECLLNQKTDSQDVATMNALLGDLVTIGSEKSQSIHAALKSRHALVVENNASRAVDLANDAISTYPDDIYMVVSKIDIGIRMLDQGVLREALDEHSRRKTGQFAARGIVAKGRALLAGMQGRKADAYAIVEKELKWMPKISIAQMKKIIAGLG